ncbi:hypothetical protein BP6252_10264 [Coleophoma cylindrospora]|uniref:Uncharacterized protein n=1 Tax=Coleophoma cylindrospora TaxID=1849047 RepID=A0A3D8QS11_9HELO|nr:hypothetical protein BP6252_10264 [Coleophoma cylindrospora]
MASRLARFRFTLPYAYRNISQSSSHDSDSDSDKIEDAAVFHYSNGISRCHAICLYTLSAVLAVALALTLIGKTTRPEGGTLGSYERGFDTEIRPDRNTLALRKVKFYGGIVYDENGTASITPPPPNVPDYFGPPSHETDHAWNLDLKDRFIAVAPKDWPSEAVEFLDRDLVQGTIRLEQVLPNPCETSLYLSWCLHSQDKWATRTALSGKVVFKPLHTKKLTLNQNYIRKSLSPEYYAAGLEKVDSNITEPKPFELHLKHCLTQIHQLIMCQLDMTPIPRTVRPTKHIHHADTDMWHVCRDFSAMRSWMYPSAEHHT